MKIKIILIENLKFEIKFFDFKYLDFLLFKSLFFLCKNIKEIKRSSGKPNKKLGC
jgi:hypothetical protein